MPKTAKKEDVFSNLAELGKDVESIAPSERIITSLEPRKPRKDEFFRCHPDLHVSLNLYEDKANRVDYVLTPAVLEVMHALVGVKRIRLTLCATYVGDYFAWPLAIPADVKANRWHATAYQAAEQAVGGWIRINPKGTHYEIHRREVHDAKEPVWPNEVEDAEDLARLTFGAGGGGDVIEDTSHDVVKRLRGAI